MCLIVCSFAEVVSFSLCAATASVSSASVSLSSSDSNFEKHCVFESDGRVLTNFGFLFLSQLESRIDAGDDIRYACYDETRKEITYRSGKVVYGNTPDCIVDISSAASRLDWSAGECDDYGSLADSSAAASSGVSIRVTAGHDMYVKLGSIKEQQFIPTNNMPYSKLPAGELRPNFACDCVNKAICPHNRMAVQLLLHAESGHQPAAALSPHDSDLVSPVAPLCLRSDSSLDAFLELYGGWSRVGSLGYHHRRPYSVRIDSRQERSYMATLLNACGLVENEDFQVYQLQHRHCSFIITNQRWVDYFHAEFGCESDADDDVPLESPTTADRYASPRTRLHAWSIDRLDARQARLVLAGIRAADDADDSPVPHERKSNAIGFASILTRDAALRDCLVQLCLHAGYSARFVVAARAEVPTQPDTWEIRYSDSMTESAILTSDILFHDSLDVGEDGLSYSYARDGRPWCVEVDHVDSLIVMQRACRSSSGVVSKASTPFIIGNCVHVQFDPNAAHMQTGANVNAIFHEQFFLDSFTPFAQACDSTIVNISLPKHNHTKKLKGQRQVEGIGSAWCSVLPSSHSRV